MSFKTADVSSEYAKDKNLKKSDIISLQEWAKKQPHLPPISELQFIMFLQSCYFSIESAKNAIDSYFLIKAHTPEFFDNRDPCLLQEAMELGLYTIMPKTTTNGDTIIFCSFLSGELTNFVFNDQFKLLDMATMLRLTQEGTMEGFIIVVDTKLAHMGHLPRMSIMSLKKIINYLQEALPVRLKGIHCVNVAPFIDTLVSLIKPFMKKELMDMLHIHSNSNEKLFEFVPRECLPTDVGGFGDSIATLSDTHKKLMIDNREFFLQDQLQISDESRRTMKIKNDGNLGFEGSFKKLDID